MLTFIEYTHSSKEKFSSQWLPLSYYKENLGRIGWYAARTHLPFDFQAQYIPEKFRLNEDGDVDPTTPALKGISFPDSYVGVLTRQEFEEIMKQDRGFGIFENQNIPDEWFEAYLPKFTDLEWFFYLTNRPLPKNPGRYTSPLEIIPYSPENFRIIFSNSRLTTKFIQEHLEDALNNCQHLIQTEAGYPFVLAHCLDNRADYRLLRRIKPKDLDKHPRLINAETFTRDDLPMWFTDKYREKVEDSFYSRPSKKTAAWLQEHRPHLTHLSKAKTPRYRLTMPCYGSSFDDEVAKRILEEKTFVISVKKTLFLFLS